VENRNGVTGEYPDFPDPDDGGSKVGCAWEQEGACGRRVGRGVAGGAAASTCPAPGEPCTCVRLQARQAPAHPCQWCVSPPGLMTHAALEVSTSWHCAVGTPARSLLPSPSAIQPLAPAGSILCNVPLPSPPSMQLILNPPPQNVEALIAAANEGKPKPRPEAAKKPDPKKKGACPFGRVCVVDAQAESPSKASGCHIRADNLSDHNALTCVALGSSPVHACCACGLHGGQVCCVCQAGKQGWLPSSALSYGEGLTWPCARWLAGKKEEEAPVKEVQPTSVFIPSIEAAVQVPGRGGGGGHWLHMPCVVLWQLFRGVSNGRAHAMHPPKHDLPAV